MSALKSAANDMIDTLSGNQKVGTRISFAIVPFATQVRVDTSLRFADWLDFRTGNVNPAHDTDRLTWDGCIMDRDKPNNTRKDAPDTARREELFPAQNCQYAGLQTVMALTQDTNAAKAKIAALTPTGNTNTTIGLAWGYNVLMRANPLGGNASPAANRTARIIVFLTDGQNTEDRFAQSPALMDADMRALCTSARSSDVRVFTIRVIDGNDSLLRDCASVPGDYYTTSDSDGIRAAFRSIASKLMTLRLSS
jgi:von Willebrand factor type A domain